MDAQQRADREAMLARAEQHATTASDPAEAARWEAKAKALRAELGQ